MGLGNVLNYRYRWRVVDNPCGRGVISVRRDHGVLLLLIILILVVFFLKVRRGTYRHRKGDIIAKV